ncbi:hypothetical protein AXJ18_gp132 [Streptomyces phage Jay2Jay]|uniref:DUF732 domain-containing protein n=1 Tax=Streptomyces phage Jay2Jay TaxID=1556290 RepID=A0A0A0RQM3_9CAUD|nr:hypothetical protein AXJ18_gp132 [Streptomyces phage Jay2Jay]AIW02642.1 hypothetical protein PBI_JAY2JAY_178 [Streptomyces phage Jay2Jay]
MRVTASLATLLILVGCGSSEDENKLTTKDKAYVKVVREEITGVQDMSDEKLVALAITACEVSSSGENFFETIRKISAYNLTESDASYLTGAAFAAYCPENLEKLDQ